MNRVGDTWYDQTVASGHQHRLNDLQRFADVGLTSLRYPVLWERVAPEAPDRRDWRWSDERLAEIRRLGMSPIVGLIHHGSGPRYTDLLDPAFARGLAGHAGAVAERYPWVRDYTPVNEPLTTARFSGLYGHWHPHARDGGAFWAMVLNQIDATRLSMRAIRAINPSARLIQTEDLGYVHATPKLRAQADFENLRRWATWDLLTGAVTPRHGLWDEIAAFGLDDRLRAIADDPCPPDLIGVNHYLTSERLLDQRQGRYPAHLRGPDGYVDIEAVRALGPEPLGWTGVLRQARDRYRLPIAVTEAHNGCTRDEQMRWFAEAWDAAASLRAEGADIRAVTAWALLGGYDWTSLLTRRDGRYECGVFDLRDGAPRETAMAPLLRSLASGEPPASPALQGRGWWRRPLRRLHRPVGRGRAERAAASAPATPLWLAGSDGPLLRVVSGVTAHRDLAVHRIGDASADSARTPWATVQVGVDRLRGWAAGSPKSVTVEITAPFSTEHDDSPVSRAAAALLSGRAVHAADIPVTPTFAPDAVDATLDLLIDGEMGAFAAQGEAVSERDLLIALARHLGVPRSRVVDVAPGDRRRLSWPAPAVTLQGARRVALPPLSTSLHRFAAHARDAHAARPPLSCLGKGEDARADLATD